MGYGRAIIVGQLGSIELDRSQPVIYDREIGFRLLFQDPGSGAEHYLVRYPAGLKARVHRHTAAQTIVVLEGRLEVNGEVIGPGAYCHFPAGEAMRHASADDAPCLFVTVLSPSTGDRLVPPSMTQPRSVNLRGGGPIGRRT
jgi:quercetin dioxygenase-like cupin family protein